MKFDLTNPQITLIKPVIERDLYYQTNQLKEYRIRQNLLTGLYYW